MAKHSEAYLKRRAEQNALTDLIRDLQRALDVARAIDAHGQVTKAIEAKLEAARRKLFGAR